ncbi:hypothetical protein Tco_1301657 [Tanacetum coccineum]
MVTPEAWMIERYIGGLSRNIKGNATSSKPKDVHETITMAQSLMDQVTQDLGKKTVDNKRKWEINHNNNNNYNQNKRQEVARVYTVRPTDKGKYAGNLPHCTKSPARARNQGNQNNQRNPPICYGCGQKGHYKNEYLKAGNQGRGNQIRGNQNHRNQNQGNRNRGNNGQGNPNGNGAHARVYRLGGEAAI